MNKRFDRTFYFFALAFVLALWITAGHCQTLTAVTGHLKAPSGSAQVQGVYAKVQLTYCGQSQAIVSGVAVLPTPASGYFTFKPDVTGLLNFNLYGNDLISCGGVMGNTRWRVSYVVNGQEGPACTQQITGPVWDLDNGNCIEVPPVQVPPTSDSTYARLDSGNGPFSGLPIFQHGIEFAGGQVLNPSAFNGTGGLVFDTGSDLPSATVEAFKCTNCNGVVVATQFPGADIGTQVNAAIAALPSACGQVVIPAGAYQLTTPIVKPRCVKLSGASTLSTVITYAATTGWAMVVGDNTASTTSYPEGSVEDITLVGPGSGTAGGIYIGGDAAGVISPANYFADHQNFNRVKVTQFHVGTQWGNNAWSDTYFESVLTNNDTNISYPVGTGGSGESLNFISTSIQNATLGINQAGFSDMYFTNCRCDYNTNCASVGQAHFINTHFEQSTGTIVSVPVTFQANVQIIGGMALLSAVGGTDANMFSVTGSTNPQFGIDGTILLASHTVTNTISWAAGGAHPSLQVRVPYHVNFSSDLDVPCTFVGCHIESGAGTDSSGETTFINTSLKLSDQGNCTMSAGTCSAQTLSHTYAAAPTCFVTWNGTGTLTGITKAPSTTTTVTPASSVNTDTAHVNWACFGN